MATEKYTTLGQSTPTASIGSGATSFTVTSASSFPLVPQFRLRLTEGATFELMLVTGVAGAVFTVTRGIEGTTAQNFTVAASVDEVLTAGALDQIRADMVQTGTYASLPTPEKAGILYLPSDAPVLSRDTGATFSAWGPLYPITVPNNTGFAWVNQGAAVLRAGSGSLQITTVGPGGSFLSSRVKSQTVPYRITLGFDYFADATTFASASIVLRTSGTGTLISHRCFVGNSFTERVQVIKYTNPTSTSGTTFDNPTAFFGSHRWFRVQNDGVNRFYSYSLDGINFTVVSTTAFNDFMVEDQVGFGVDIQGANQMGMNVFSLEIV